MKGQKTIIFALIAILMWSTAGTAFKLALRELDFTQLLFISANTAWIVLGLVVLLSKRKPKLTSKAVAKSALSGFLNPFLYYLILLKAYSLLPAQIAQPLNYTWPIMLVILSIAFLGQKVRWFDFVAIAISFSGVIVISLMGESSFKPDQSSLLGIILASGSSIIWASYFIINVRDHRDELEKIFLNFLFGALFISIWIISTQNLPELSISWIPGIYVGITEMAIAFVFWLTAMKWSKNNSRISNLVFISPFLALVFIHLILKEDIFWSTFIGLILIVTGILFQQTIVNREQRQKNQ
jgi:drug/metabolite transporter (DMT)-like permease